MTRFEQERHDRQAYANASQLILQEAKKVVEKELGKEYWNWLLLFFCGATALFSAVLIFDERPVLITVCFLSMMMWWHAKEKLEERFEYRRDVVLKMLDERKNKL